MKTKFSDNICHMLRTEAFKNLHIHLFFVLLIFSSCKEKENATNQFANLSLPRYSGQQLETDFNLLVNSLKEAHTGLYWYSTENQFDSVVAQQKNLITDSLNGLEFYNIVAPIVSFTKEDHCDIALSEKLDQTLTDKGLFLPLSVINLGNQTLILNNPLKDQDLKGFVLLSVNDIPVNEICDKLFNTFASDGFIISSKYRYLDFRGFSQEYGKVIGQQKENILIVLNPKTNKAETHTVLSISSEELRDLNKKLLQENAIRKEIDKPARLEFADHNIAILTFRTFSNRRFETQNMSFKNFVDSSFIAISTNGAKNLIIDIRDNGGGSEGNEDYLFSYLNDKRYNKYKYVEASGLTFSFLNFTDYAAKDDQRDLEEELRDENYEAPDGKYYRKPNINTPEPLKENPFNGNVYVLISGWTYSGGAEFASLMKEHTKAVFIGEETGGGFYGNTSGTSLELTLPNTELIIDIPILKFVLDVKNGKSGRGVIPDYEVQPTFDEFINGYDAEMEYAKALIGNEKH